MDMEQKQAELIDYFVKQAASLKGSALVNVIVEATSHPSLFAFSEILSVPTIIELEGTGNSVFRDLLRMYAYGTWSEYKSDVLRLPQLVPAQVLKLKQITVLTLAETNKVVPYDTLMQELDVTNVRELEDFLINDCMYVVSFGISSLTSSLLMSLLSRQRAKGQVRETTAMQGVQEGIGQLWA